MVALRDAGMDVLRSLDAGMNSHKDEEQLEFATWLGRAVYTRNAKDFHRLHRDYQAACGLPFAVPDFLAIVFLALGACRCCKKPLEF